MILAFETSTRHASLALYDRAANTVVREAAFTTDRAHNAAIFGPLDELLSSHREQLSALVVGLGPGSYGGVRVGIAVANGLSVALGLPVAGRTSLEAWETGIDSYVLVGDARRGSYFVAEVRTRVLQGDPELVEEGELASYLAPFRAEGLAIHTSDVKVAAFVPGAVLSHPTAAMLAKRFREYDFTGAISPLEPVYLRAPYITEPKVRK